jgi:putative glutamine amidotransferase
MQPFIGITVDRVDPEEEAGASWYARHAWYALREKYAHATHLAGGTPIMIPYVMDAIPQYVSMLSGLLISGGGFDIPPNLYGVQKQHPTVNTRPLRTQFELALTKAMLDANKPVLGICGGMQLINVLLGGTLIQHIPDEAPSHINHVQEQERHIPQHTVHIKDHTLLHRLVGGGAVPVNSIHHQAIQILAPGLLQNAIAPDGLIEGLESSAHKFCLGVQWHPEFHVSPADKAILEGFIHACVP